MHTAQAALYLSCHTSLHSSWTKRMNSSNLLLLECHPLHRQPSIQLASWQHQSETQTLTRENVCYFARILLLFPQSM